MAKPDYNLIYSDILEKIFPEKKEELEYLLAREIVYNVDIIEINEKIFGVSTENYFYNKRLRSYTKSDIFKILEYQKEYKLNNKQLATHFALSRNTVTKWKRLFIV